MRYVDEFRDPVLAKALVKEIEAVCARLERGRDKPLAVMEVCGGHTHAIFRYGLEDLLPDLVEFVHGPGCPVCVLPIGRIDNAIHLAEAHGVILCSYGDKV